MLREANIQAGLSIYDYANILYGGFDNIVTLIQLNPDFESMDVVMEDFAAKKIVYNDAYYQARTVQVQLSKAKEESTNGTIKGLEGQNLYDVCLMAYSDFDNFVKLCIDNGINSTNDHNVSFKEFIFDTKLNNNLTLQGIIKKKGYVFATGTYPVEVVEGFLIQENGFFLLQENGDKIYL